MTSRTLTQNHQRQRGAALVEYAFVVMFFLSLLFGMSGFGHFLYVYHAINSAAKEGTRQDVVEITLLLPASQAEALIALSRSRRQSVGQILRGLIDRALLMASSEN